MLANVNSFITGWKTSHVLITEHLLIWMFAFMHEQDLFKLNDDSGVVPWCWIWGWGLPVTAGVQRRGWAAGSETRTPGLLSGTWVYKLPAEPDPERSESHVCAWTSPAAHWAGPSPAVSTCTNTLSVRKRSCKNGVTYQSLCDRDMNAGNGNTNTADLAHTKIQGLKIQRERMIRFKPLYSLWDSPADCRVLGWKHLRKSQKKHHSITHQTMQCSVGLLWMLWI